MLADADLLHLTYIVNRLKWSDGIKTVILISYGILIQRSGFVKLENFAVSLHHTIMPCFIKFCIQRLEKNDCQLFLITQDYDLIEKFVEAAEELDRQSFIKYYRLEKNNEQLDVITMNHAELKVCIDNKWEIR